MRPPIDNLTQLSTVSRQQLNVNHFGWYAVLFFGWFLFSPVIQAEELQYDVVLFSEMEGFNRLGLPSNSAVTSSALEVEFDAFMTARKGSWNGLLEAQVKLSTEEDTNTEIERLIIGRDISAGLRGWLGRFHAPYGVWNLNFNHGTYLKTSIGRPSIIDWEDSGGPLITHVTGLSMDGHLPYQDNQSFDYQMSLGLAPVYLNGRLHPLDVLKPLDEDNRLFLSSRFAYKPDALGLDEVGLFAAVTQIPFQSATIKTVNQRVLGAFAYLLQNQWEMISSLFYVSNKTHALNGSSNTDHFSNAYLQVAHELMPRWKGYGRIEVSRNTAANAYLAHFPNFVRTRQMLGLRFELKDHQAIKIQLSNSIQASADHYGQIDVEWSGVLK